MTFRPWLAPALALVSCSAATNFDTSFFDSPPGDGDADADTDADGDTDGDGDADQGVSVDILMMVDNSNSMAEEQQNLTGSLRVLLQALTDPPDDDGDGELDYRFVTDLHLGVISSDLGSGGFLIVGCDSVGDDGELLHAPSPDVAPCDAGYPTFLTYTARQPDLGIDDDFTCIATLGTGGCGFEQPFASVMRALGVQAQRGGSNEGFLRPNAALAVVLLTDEDDCSVEDPIIFDITNEELGDPNLRCAEHPELLMPEGGLASALTRLAPDAASLTLVGIVGIPPALVELSPAQLHAPEIQTNADFLRILDDPSMDIAIDPDQPNQFVPSCDVDGLGLAFPPRRIVEVLRQAHAQGANAVVQSICQQDYSGAMRALARMVGRR